MQDDAYSRVISVRGRTGAVLALEPSQGEAGLHVAACLQKCLPPEGLQQVEHMATDLPSRKFLTDVRSVCPNLKILSLDPTHTAMKYEQALGGKKSQGSSLMRQLLVKFTTHDANVQGNIWGPVYEGGVAPAQTEQEKRLRAQILDASMSKYRARRVLQAMEALLLWPTRIEFIEAVAALAAIYQQDMQRKLDGTRLTVAKVLHSVTSEDKIEWLFNNLRYRQFLPPNVRMLMPSGTTSNEALHAELNAWYRQVQQLHRSTLCLKLRVQCLTKFLAHETALHFPTTAQLPSQMVIAGAASKPLWTAREWKAWTQLRQQDLPLHRRKAAERGRVRECKRPACAAPRRNKRTPFTLQRSQGVRRTGVHKRRQAG